MVTFTSYKYLAVGTIPSSGIFFLLFVKKWMASAAPPGHTHHQYVIGLGLECPQWPFI